MSPDNNQQVGGGLRDNPQRNNPKSTGEGIEKSKKDMNKEKGDSCGC